MPGAHQYSIHIIGLELNIGAVLIVFADLIKEYLPVLPAWHALGEARSHVKSRVDAHDSRYEDFLHRIA